MALTPKQESFCHAYVETGSASEAYRRAYDAGSMSAASIKVEACRLLDNPNVALTVDKLRRAVEDAHKMTVADILRELEEARIAALTCDTPQSGAAVSATMGKAKILGYDKQQFELTGRDGGPVEVTGITIRLVKPDES